MNYEQWTVNNEQWTVNNEQGIVNNEQGIVSMKTLRILFRDYFCFELLFQFLRFAPFRQLFQSVASVATNLVDFEAGRVRRPDEIGEMGEPLCCKPAPLEYTLALARKVFYWDLNDWSL